MTTRTNDPGEPIVFPPFTLDFRAGQLIRGTETIPLRPKTWAVLRYLAERPRVLVSRNEIFSDVWKGAAVTDDTLTKSISEIRQALRDNCKPHRLIETVHGRGFRFIAKIDGRPAAIDELQSASAPLATEPAPLNAYFVGRNAELRRLHAHFAKARAGQRQIVFITGEPGIGKTALVETFLAQLAAPTRRPSINSGNSGPACDPGPLIIDHCSPSTCPLVGHGCAVEQKGACEAYLPVLTAVEQLGRAPEHTGFVSLLRRFAPSWLAQLPWLVESADADAVAQLGGVRPERMQREFCAFIEALAATRPVCLVLEDLHWSDPASAELLFMLAQRREPTRLLVIATYRPADAAVPEHPLLRAKETVVQRRQGVEIAVHSLPLTGVHSYIERRFPGCVRPDELARLVHDHTDGSPLFMTAVLDDLIARGWLVHTDPGWALTVPAAKVNLRVPEDIRQMIAAQLHAMSPNDQAVLETASVAGIEFTAHTVAAGLGADVEAAEAVCERLSRTHRFVRVIGTTEWPGGGIARRYGFLHALHRHVVYEALPEGRRQRLHQRVGEALEAAYGAQAVDCAAELAAHFERSRDTARGIKYLTEAAVRVQPFAAREAITYLERALAITTHLPDARARRQELEVRSVLGSALGTLHGYPSEPAWQNYERVRALCEEVGTPGDLYRALHALWPAQNARGDRASKTTAERLVGLADAVGDPELRAQAQVILGRTLFWEGNFIDAWNALQGVLGFWNHQPGNMDGPALLEPPGIAVHFYGGVTSWFLGYPDRARDRVREALAVSGEVAHPFVVAGGFLHGAYINHLWRDDQEVQRLAQRTLALAEEHDFPFWKGMAAAVLGWALAQQGKPARGAELVREGLRQHRATGAAIICSHMLAFLADACLRLGDVATGLQAVEEGLALVGSTFDWVYEPEIWRLKGELLLKRVDSRQLTVHKTRGRKAPPAAAQAAEACLQRALDIARARQARSLELRAAMSLARLWHTQGRSTDARTLLADIYGWFTEGFETPDLRDAQALLAGPLA